MHKDFLMHMFQLLGLYFKDICMPNDLKLLKLLVFLQAKFLSNHGINICNK